MRMELVYRYNVGKISKVAWGKLYDVLNEPPKATALNNVCVFPTEFTKMRGGYWPEDVCASLVSEQLLDGEYKWKWNSELINGSRVHDIKQLLEEEKVISQKEIAAKLDTSEPTISRAMKMAKQRGILTQRWINGQFRAAVDHRVAEASVSEVADF